MAFDCDHFIFSTLPFSHILDRNDDVAVLPFNTPDPVITAALFLSNHLSESVIGLNGQSHSSFANIMHDLLPQIPKFTVADPAS